MYFPAAFKRKKREQTNTTHLYSCKRETFKGVVVISFVLPLYHLVYMYIYIYIPDFGLRVRREGFKNLNGDSNLLRWLRWGLMYG